MSALTMTLGPQVRRMDGTKTLGVKWKLNRRFRVWALGMTGFGGIAAGNMSSSAYHLPIFRTVNSFGGYRVWFVAWLLVAILSVSAAVTARPALWRSGCLVLLANSVTWYISLAWEHYVHGATLTPLGQLLWLWVIFSTILVMLAPYQVVGEMHLGPHSSTDK